MIENSKPQNDELKLTFYQAYCIVCNKRFSVPRHIGEALEKGSIAGAICNNPWCKTKLYTQEVLNE